MSLFTSDHERWTWLWIFVVLIAIYSSLGLAGRISSFLRELDLLRISLNPFLLLISGFIIQATLPNRVYDFQDVVSYIFAG